MPLPGRPDSLPRLRPEYFHRNWWESNPDAVSVRWIATFTCTRRGAHKAKMLADVAGILMNNGQLEFEFYLPLDSHGNSYVHMAGWGQPHAMRFLCPACPIDWRPPEVKMAAYLRLFGESSPGQIDISELAAKLDTTR